MDVVALVDTRDSSRAELGRALVGGGFEVSTFADWQRARTAFTAIRVDAVVLGDWRRLGGRGAHRYLRGPARNAPFVLVTDSPMRPAGNRFAAVVAYPAPAEVVCAAVRTACESAQPALRLGRWSLDVQRRQLDWNGQSVDLTPVETHLLRELIAERGEYVNSSDLVSRAWGISTLLDRRVLYTHVAWLRRKLQDGIDAPDPIVSERQRGYRFDPGRP